MAQIPLPLYITRAGQLWQHKEHKNSDKEEKARELHYGWSRWHKKTHGVQGTTPVGAINNKEKIQNASENEVVERKN